MTWMAPIPARDTTLAAHWVARASRFVPPFRDADGSIATPGWPAVCGVACSTIPHGAPGERQRPTCGDCATFVGHRYDGVCDE